MQTFSSYRRSDKLPCTSHLVGSLLCLMATAAVLTAQQPANSPQQKFPNAKLTFVGGIDDSGKLVTFHMVPTSIEEWITKGVTVLGQKTNVGIKRSKTAINRIPAPMPLTAINVRNLTGRKLSDEEVRAALKSDKLVLQVDEPAEITPELQKLFKPDTLILSFQPMGQPQNGNVQPTPMDVPSGDPVGPGRFPTGVPPSVMYVDQLDANGTATLHMPYGVMKVKLAKFPIVSLKNGAVQQITIAEAQKQIGRGTYVAINHDQNGLPDPRYLEVFRDGALILTQANTPGSFEKPPFPLEEHLANLRSPDPEVRRNAANQLTFAMADADIARKATPTLVAALEDENGDASLATVNAFRFAGPWAQAAAPALAQLLHVDGAEASLASESLRNMGPAAAGIVPELLKISETGSARARVLAADALHSIAPDEAKKTVSGLLQIVATDQSNTRNYAARVLPKIAPEQAAPAIPLLLADLKSEQFMVRSEAASSLSYIHPAIGKPFVTQLLEQIKNQSDPNKDAICVHLATLVLRFDPQKIPDVVSVLVNGTYAGFSITRGRAAAALLPVVPETTTDCREILMDDLRNANPMLPVQFMLTEDGGADGVLALFHGTPAQIREAQQQIVLALQHVSLSERYRTLCRWGTAPRRSKDMLPIVQMFANDSDEMIRIGAQFAAAQISKAAPNVNSTQAAVAATAPPAASHSKFVPLPRLGFLSGQATSGQVTVVVPAYVRPEISTARADRVFRLVGDQLEAAPPDLIQKFIERRVAVFVMDQGQVLDANSRAVMRRGAIVVEAPAPDISWVEAPPPSPIHLPKSAPLTLVRIAARKGEQANLERSVSEFLMRQIQLEVLVDGQKKVSSKRVLVRNTKPVYETVVLSGVSITNKRGQKIGLDALPERLKRTNVLLYASGTIDPSYLAPIDDEAIILTIRQQTGPATEVPKSPRTRTTGPM